MMRMSFERFFAPARIQVLLILCVCGVFEARGQESGSVAVVVYNKRMSDSKKIAEHYAKKRNVPASQIIGLDLPESERMTRQEYNTRLRKPLLEFLIKHELFTFKRILVTSTNQSAPLLQDRVVQARIRYAVLCYGVPVIIARDPTLLEPEAARLPAALAPRNEAAVDSELALLPYSESNYVLAGPLRNAFYGTTNASDFSPTNNILLVARLDGPSYAIANALVDKAMQAEDQGLWGRAYFDLRGIAEGEYKIGDDWIRNASEVCRIMGFETVVDTRPETFPASFPMSQIACYAGWYDGAISGPFTLPKVEFMPGAVAYHLHSYSASSIRNSAQNWVGPLLAKGVTATMGCVDEPYLAGTPDIGVFFARMIAGGFSFGEAAYASTASISWQTTVVGDPLYRPFGMAPELRHQKLLRDKSNLIEWSYLRLVNINLARGLSALQAVSYLEQLPVAKKSAVLMEKLGDLYQAIGKPSSCIYAYQTALKLNPTPQQTIRLLLTLGGRLETAGRLVEARDAYKTLFASFPEYADRETIRVKIVELTDKAQAHPSN